jgi:hypothetical protein
MSPSEEAQLMVPVIMEPGSNPWNSRCSSFGGNLSFSCIPKHNKDPKSLNELLHKY